ncbi:jg18741, partial [Pararge aegeria aegeria]
PAAASRLRRHSGTSDEAHTNSANTTHSHASQPVCMAPPLQQSPAQRCEGSGAALTEQRINIVRASGLQPRPHYYTRRACRQAQAYLIFKSRDAV